MKTRALWIGCCMLAVLIFAGCHSTEQKEAPAEKETKKETVSIDTSKNAASENSVSNDGASGNTSVQIQDEKNKMQGSQRVESTPGVQNSGEDAVSPSVAPAEAAQEGEDLGQGTDGTADGGDMQQCPYCDGWFSTEPDGDLWNPYDRHLLEERDSSQSEEYNDGYPDDGGAADGEMVQCPDCGNWYEEGNIFRNHICEGKVYPDDGETTDGEMVQCPDCGNWYEEGNIFRNHVCEGR